MQMSLKVNTDLGSSLVLWLFSTETIAMLSYGMWFDLPDCNILYISFEDYRWIELRQRTG